jgi:hypothetical protein
MAGMDLQMLFSFGHNIYLDQLEYVPDHVDILEIYQFEVGYVSLFV